MTTLPWYQQKRPLTLIFSLLILLLLAVIFVLPNMVGPITSSQQAQPPSSTATAPAGGNSSGSSALESPFQQAQLAKERRATQDILAGLLDKQKDLQAKQVQQWAANPYQQALELANDGDQDYRQQHFESAKQKYRQASQQLGQLQLESKEVLQQQLQQGQQALAEGDEKSAIDSFKLALHLDRDHPQAQQGMLRAEVLGTLLAHLKQGELQEKTGHLEQALTLYQQALAQDSQSTLARQAVTRATQAITQRDYTHAMSQGYDQLQQQQFSAARQAFKRAQSLKPEDRAASQALIQTQNQSIQKKIKQHLSSATTLEQQEKWQAADTNYHQALKLDNTLIDARIGQIRSSTRAKLDQKLQAAIDAPERLLDDQVLAEARQLALEAEKVLRGDKGPGKRLQQQLTQLRTLLQQASISVTVILQSDNATQVSLYHVGRLGNFTRHTLELKPGRYTLVGARAGYRDVRREFIVSANQPQQTIVIRCDNKISLGG